MPREQEGQLLQTDHVSALVVIHVKTFPHF